VSGSALACFCAAYCARRWSGFCSRAIARVAAISYPLYLVHLIPGCVLARVLVDHGVGKGATIAAAMAAAFLASTAVHMLIEMPTHEIGRWLALRRPAATLQAVTPA